MSKNNNCKGCENEEESSNFFGYPCINCSRRFVDEYKKKLITEDQYTTSIDYLFNHCTGDKKVKHGQIVADYVKQLKSESI